MVAMSLCTDVETTPNGEWPTSAYGELDTKDKTITFRDTLGRNDGRTFDGEWQEAHGFQVKVRARTPDTAYVKANEIAIAMDQSLLDYSVTFGTPSTTYLVHSVSRDALIPLGREPTTSRSLVTFNGVVWVNKIG